ncbi:MAG TPA: NFACT family protein [bacterium]|jgi:predicted ribosome quality control (RQC) complex YloA/Tae2 family protein
MTNLLWSFDSVVLAAVAADLEPLVGSVAGRVVQPGRDEILLALHPQRSRRARSAGLLMSIHPRWGRVHLSGPMEGETAASFCRLLRARIEGSPLRSIVQPEFERTISLRFQTIDGDVELIAEIMGRHSNLVAVGGGEVLGSLKTVTARMSSVRQVLAGHAYVPPPKDRPTPLELDEAGLRTLLARATGPLARRLAGSILGIGPMMAAELVARAAAAMPLRVHDPDEDAAALWPVLEDLTQRVRARRFEPTLYRADGNPVGFTPFPFLHVDGVIAEPQASMSEAVAAVAAPAAAAAAVEIERGGLQTAVHAALSRVMRTEAELRKSLAEAEGSEDLKQRGELLFAYASQIPARATEATVPGFDGRPVTIPLDATLTPAENARRLFKRYARIRSASGEVTARLREVSAQREYLESVQVMIETATGSSDLAGVRDELIDEGVLKLRRGRGRPSARAGPRRYRTGSGHEVLVGRTNAENDLLTFTLARPDDLWFHAQGVPGAHIILRTQGRRIGEEVIREAAQIAAYFSRARSASVAPVAYTQRRYVKKPRGARPGLVTIRNEKTVMVEPRLL